jgi:hypothetical protein
VAYDVYTLMNNVNLVSLSDIIELTRPDITDVKKGCWRETVQSPIVHLCAKLQLGEGVIRADTRVIYSHEAA